MDFTVRLGPIFEVAHVHADILKSEALAGPRLLMELVFSVCQLNMEELEKFSRIPSTPETLES